MHFTAAFNVAGADCLPLLLPGTTGVDALFSVVAKTTNVGSVSSSQPFYFVVPHTKTQCLSHCLEQQKHAVNVF